jgi:hypothetical protein
MPYFHNLLDDYEVADLPIGSPYWIIEVFRLGRPLSYSRRSKKSIKDTTQGVTERIGKPLIITSDCVGIGINCSKRSHIKTLSAVLKGKDYLNPDLLLPGDWVMCWLLNSEDAFKRTLRKVESNEQANLAEDGFKFLGRLHDIKKSVRINRVTGTKTVDYHMTCAGFDELDSVFFYDFALATSAAQQGDIQNWMAQLGLPLTKLYNESQVQAGRMENNASLLMEASIDTILGAGVSPEVNRPVERAKAGATSLNIGEGRSIDTSRIQIAPQAAAEAPFAYLVPMQVGIRLGLDPADKSKQGSFGFADILQRIIGVQKYATDYIPELKTLKGTFLPGFFPVNEPLWSLLNKISNSAINELYTVYRKDSAGAVYPTFVARQIPFSSEAIEEDKAFELTRFLSLPRWVGDEKLIFSATIGRSNATRTNLVHVYGQAEVLANNDSVTSQLVRNPPIFDNLDIQRSGVRSMIKTVNCGLTDQLKTPEAWMSAIADWSMGSQFTLNGEIDLLGIQAPICEGDNFELMGVVFHIEAVSHSVSISEDGNKSWITKLELSNGVPADQSFADEFPVYAGFNKQETGFGDPAHAIDDKYGVADEHHS